MPRPYPTYTALGRLMRDGAWTAADFAAVTGINARYLTEYLAGRRAMTPEHLDAAAAALDVDVDDIIGDDVEDGIGEEEVPWWLT